MVLPAKSRWCRRIQARRKAEADFERALAVARRSRKSPRRLQHLGRIDEPIIKCLNATSARIKARWLATYREEDWLIVGRTLAEVDDVRWDFLPYVIIPPKPLIAICSLVDPECGLNNVRVCTATLEAEPFLGGVRELPISVPILHFHRCIGVLGFPRSVSAYDDGNQRPEKDRTEYRIRRRALNRLQEDPFEVGRGVLLLLRHFRPLCRECVAAFL
jgi:hypothetical protein